MVEYVAPVLPGSFALNANLDAFNGDAFQSTASLSLTLVV